MPSYVHTLPCHASALRGLRGLPGALTLKHSLKHSSCSASGSPRTVGAQSKQVLLLDFRMWIWIGIAYNLVIALILTYLVGIALTYMNPPKARPTTPADEVAMRNKVHQEAVMRSRTQRRLKVSLARSLTHGSAETDSPLQTVQSSFHRICPALTLLHYAFTRGMAWSQASSMEVTFGHVMPGGVATGIHGVTGDLRASGLWEAIHNAAPAVAAHVHVPPFFQ